MTSIWIAEVKIWACVGSKNGICVRWWFAFWVNTIVFCLANVLLCMSCRTGNDVVHTHTQKKRAWENVKKKKVRKKERKAGSLAVQRALRAMQKLLRFLVDAISFPFAFSAAWYLNGTSYYITNFNSTSCCFSWPMLLLHTHTRHTRAARLVDYKMHGAYGGVHHVKLFYFWISRLLE